MTVGPMDEVVRVVELRRTLGWSQERMAREIGVALCTYGRWERMESKPGNEIMVQRLRTVLRKHKV